MLVAGCGQSGVVAGSHSQSAAPTGQTIKQIVAECQLDAYRIFPNSRKDSDVPDYVMTCMTAKGYDFGGADICAPSSLGQTLFVAELSPECYKLATPAKSGG